VTPVHMGDVLHWHGLFQCTS